MTVTYVCQTLAKIFINKTKKEKKIVNEQLNEMTFIKEHLDEIKWVVMIQEDR